MGETRTHFDILFLFLRRRQKWKKQWDDEKTFFFLSRFFLRSSATNLVECESRKQIYRLEVRRRNALFFLLKRQSGVSHVNLDGKEKEEEEEEETEQLCLLFGGGSGYSWSFILLLKAGSYNRVFKGESLVLRKTYHSKISCTYL